MAALLTAAIAALLVFAGVAEAQPPWLPWTIENDNLVSGLTAFPHPAGCDTSKVGGGCVWVAEEKSLSVQACLALCEESKSCNSFDFATSWEGGGIGVCKFRSDHFWSHEPGTGMNHTCGTRVTPDPTPPPPGPPAPLPPLPPPPPVKPPLGKQPNIVFVLTDVRAARAPRLCTVACAHHLLVLQLKVLQLLTARCASSGCRTRTGHSASTTTRRWARWRSCRTSGKSSSRRAPSCRCNIFPWLWLWPWPWP